MCINGELGLFTWLCDQLAIAEISFRDGEVLTVHITNLMATTTVDLPAISSFSVLGATSPGPDTPAGVPE